MNYYEHHIGDYAEATGHLTFVEDAAYTRLIRKYYAQEKPLPADVKIVQRLIGARTKEEKVAVQSVLEEFFFLRDDGWHQERCDREIAEYRAGEPEREAKKSNEEMRLKRHREERARLFSLINQAGMHAPWNTTMGELRAMAGRNGLGAETVLPPLQATAPATPVTATQTPVTRHQSPVTNTHTPELTPKPKPLSDAPSAAGQPAKAGTPKATTKPPPETGPTWDAYSHAYRERYHVDPVRNAKVNGMLANLVKRLGASEAPLVAAFYLLHQGRNYVLKMHSVDLLVNDCEKLRTEWATRTQMTATKAQQQDQTQANYDAFAPLIAEAEAQEARERNSHGQE